MRAIITVMVTSFSRTRRVVFDLVRLESSEHQRGQRQFLGLRSEDLVGIKSSERQVLPLASYQRPEMIKNKLIFVSCTLFYDHYDYYYYYYNT